MTDQPTDSRRVPVIAGVSVLVAGVLAVGAYAGGQILGGGAQPETVMPDSVIAFASVDIDPGAKQKIQAIRTLRKFPELKDAIKVNEKDDIRKRVFEEAIADGKCKGKVDYAKDVEPWLGDKVGVAAVDLGEQEPSPLVALKVGDEDAAAKGMTKIQKCAGGKSASAHAFRDGYVLLSDSQGHLDKILAGAKKATLADDKSFTEWDDKSGDDGIVNFYVSKKATDVIGTMLPAELASQAGDLDESFKDFKGMAGALRFADGGLELEMAVGGAGDYLGKSRLDEAVTQLPKDTALSVALSVPGDFAKTLTSRLEDAFGGESSDLVTQAESQTGLSLPEDLQTLLGKAVVFAIGGEAPADLAQTSGPADVPLGLKIHGDADKIKAVVSKAEERVGQKLSDADFVQEADGNVYVLASNQSFAAKLRGKGGLSDNGAFKEVVPKGGDSSFAVFVNFDSAWRDSIIGLLREQGGQDAANKAEANTAPLKALGLSGWADGNVSRFLLKITTD